jgi:hypothetical protein
LLVDRLAAFRAQLTLHAFARREVLGAIEGRPGEMYLARMARPIPHSDRSAAGLQSVKVTRCLTCGVELIRMLSDWGRDDHWASELATANRGIEERISRVSGQERDNVATQ